MATTTTTTNKPLNPRAQDLSPKGYNRANIFSGKALSFDGVNDIITGSSAALPASDYTIAAWFNLDTLKASGIVVWGDEAAFERRALFVWNGGGSGPYYLYSSTYTSNIAAATQLSAGRWYFGVVTLTAAGAAKIYLNGREDGSGTNTLAAYTGTQYKVGDTGSSEFTDGKIAGVRVFNQVLTPAQVSDLYLNPEKIVPDGVASSALKLWLPMMEGAGASAYDGSGNGNDGTINGATWTAGVGAPVAQTALVSWNKGTNRLQYSEDFTNAAWTKERCSVTANADTAPNGTTTADRITTTNTTFENYVRQAAAVGISAGTTLTTMAYAKKGTHTFLRMRNLFVDNGADDGNAWFNLDTGAIGTIQSGQTATMTAVGNGWYLCTLTGVVGTTNLAYLVDFATATTNGSNVPSVNGSIFIWGAANYIGAVGPYIKTNATAQTSAVLVPEGLTAGASIFGTDIITPRNAFALNLDGASWAQVGDNASLDFGSGEFSVEAWGFWSLNDNQQAIIQKGDAGIGASRGINLFRTTSNTLRVIVTANSEVTIQGAAAPISTWKHVVITKDASLLKMYVDGALYGSTSSAAGSVDVSDALRVGTFNNTQYTNGQLANPRIYNRALTAAEVLRNYNADKAKFGL